MAFKRIVSVSVALLLMISVFAVNAQAANRMKLDKPENLYFSFLYPNEGSEYISLMYMLPEEICRYGAMTSEQKTEKYGKSGKCVMQLDWSVDSESDAWHYSAGWDELNGEYLLYELGLDYIASGELFWFTYDEAAAKCQDGIKTGTNENGESFRVFDFDNHSLYVRARYGIIEDGGKNYFSEWSDAFYVNACKDDNQEFKEVKKLGKIEISNVVASGYDVYFDTDYSENAMKASWEIKKYTSANDDMLFESQIRVDGGEWTYWSTSDELYPYGIQTREYSINEADAAKIVDYRCRLYYPGSIDENVPEISTDWSDVITLSGGAVTVNEDSGGDVDSGDKCSLCGICPQPLGLCLFIWLAVILVAGLVIFFIFKPTKGGKKQKLDMEAAAKERLERSRAEEEERKAQQKANNENYNQ